MLRDLEDESGRAASDLKTVEDGREVLVELNVDDGTDNSDDASLRASDRLGRRLSTRMFALRVFKLFFIFLQSNNFCPEHLFTFLGAAAAA